MDGKEAIEKRKNPREGANPLSALTFAWILKIFWVGYKRDLEIDDLTRPLKEHKSSYLGEKISTAWEEEVKRFNKQQEKSKQKGKDNGKKKTPSLNRVLIKVFGARIALYGVALAIMEIVLRLLQPIFLGMLISYYRPLKHPYVPIHASGIIGEAHMRRHEEIKSSLSPIMKIVRVYLIP